LSKVLLPNVDVVGTAPLEAWSWCVVNTQVMKPKLRRSSLVSEHAASDSRTATWEDGMVDSDEDIEPESTELNCECC
jgi:hypothetical protein